MSSRGAEVLMLSSGVLCRKLRSLADDTSVASLHMIVYILLHVIPEEMLVSQRKCVGPTLMTSVVMNTGQCVYLQGLRHNKLKSLLFGSRDPL